MKKRRTRKMNMIRKTRRRTNKIKNKKMKKKLYSNKNKKKNIKRQLGGLITCLPKRSTPESNCHVCRNPIEGGTWWTGAHTCRKCGHTFCGESCGTKTYKCMLISPWSSTTYWPDNVTPFQWQCNICNGVQSARREHAAAAAAAAAADASAYARRLVAKNLTSRQGAQNHGS